MERFPGWRPWRRRCRSGAGRPRRRPVEHLILDPYLKTDELTLDSASRQAIEDAGEEASRRLWSELALPDPGQVSSASVDEVPALTRKPAACWPCFAIERRQGHPGPPPGPNQALHG